MFKLLTRRYFFILIGVWLCNGTLLAQDPSAIRVDSIVKAYKGIASQENFEPSKKLAWYIFDLQIGLEDQEQNNKLVQVLNSIYQTSLKHEIPEESRKLKALIAFTKIYKDNRLAINDLIKVSSYKEIENTKLHFHILQKLKGAYFATEQYNEIITVVPIYYTLYKKYANQNNDLAFIKNCDLAFTHYGMKDFPQAINYYKKAIAAKSPYTTTGLNHNNIGLCFAAIGQKDSAEYYYQQALSFVAKYQEQAAADDSFVRFQVNYLNALIAANRVDNNLKAYPYHKAKNIYLNQLALATQTIDNQIIVSSYIQLANLALFNNKPNEALGYIDLGLNKLTPYKGNENIKQLLEIKSRSFLVLGILDSAYYYYDQLQQFKDSLIAYKTKLNYETASVKYLSNERETELASIKKEQDQHKNFNRYLQAGLFMLIGLMSILWFYANNQSKLKNSILVEKTKLQHSLDERELLLREIHHRVKNNLQVILSMMQLQSVKAKNPETINIFKESRQYIISMSMIHEMLYNQDDMSKVNMQHYFDQFLGHLAQQAKDKNITYMINAEKTELFIDVAIVLGLLTSELVTNSIKHAFDGENGLIKLSLQKNEKSEMVFCYTDNGKGLPEGFEIGTGNTLGLKLIGMLAEQINAQITYIKENGFGIKMIFSLKNKQS